MSQSHHSNIQQALVFHQQGALEQAREIYQAVLLQDPNHSEALHLLGVLFSQQGNYSLAINLMDQALSVSPNDPNIWSNRARSLLESKQFDLALSSAQQALTLQPSHADAWYQIGSILTQTKNFSSAIQHFTRAIELNPNHANAAKYRCICLRELGHLKSALAECERARVLLPNDLELKMIRGMIHIQICSYREAIDDFQAVIKVNPQHFNAWYNCGQCLRVVGRLRESLACLTTTHQLNPNVPGLEDELIHVRACLCEWGELHKLPLLAARIHQGTVGIDPFVALSLFDDAHLLLKNAQIYSHSQRPVCNPALPPHPRHHKIKVGYYSSDFCRHPMAMLIPEVIESHNRNLFEIYLFSLTPGPEDVFRQRLRRASDHFILVESLNDSQVAKKSQELGIDIAIDLMGYTTSNRYGIFCERCAPVQAIWVGMAGTSGSPVIDYIIADPVVIPDRNRHFYSEQVVHLPCYWPNDSTRPIAEQTPTRDAMGLPKDSFVFCCFNASFKILPDTFACWLRILAATPNSVLWLTGSNVDSNDNLREAAKRQNIPTDRLVFSSRLPSIEDHLARHRLPDLFLDSFPYNAHTTAVDALWAGLPVLTRSGQSFASRVAASLLSRIGLPELITDSQADFEARAIYLANDGRSELKAIREKLGILRKTSPLFDGKAFAKDLEKAYQAMYDRSQTGLKPDFISLV